MQSAKIKLSVLAGSLAGKEFVFDGPAHCTIGRAHDCDIRLPVEFGQMEASRHHCLLVIEPPAVRIRDLGSLNGTYVNGVHIGRRRQSQPAECADPGPAAEHQLGDGDTILVGHNLMRLSVSAAEEAPKARMHGGWLARYLGRPAAAAARGPAYANIASTTSPATSVNR